MEPLLDTIVIGAGQAGLVAGYHLQRAGLRFTILEASAQPGGSWPQYYDSLRLFSPARFSSLPGLPFPGDPGRYPSRDDVVGYLQAYAAQFRLPVVTSTRVAEVTQDGAQFLVHSDDGRVFAGRSLIAATGAFHRPYLPQLSGEEQFRGTIAHASGYRTPTPFVGQRIVVVGGGNSAVQIAAELARTARVTLATRHPLRFVAQRPLGRDIHFWLWLLRLDTSPFDSPSGGIFARLASGKGPQVLDAGVYRAALAAGAPDVQPMFSAFTAAGVRWPDGSEEAVDSVIFATGYRPSLDYLRALGALDAAGLPLHRHGVSTILPGLGFVGLENQRTFASATLRGVGADAAVVVRALRSQLRAAVLVEEPAWRRCCPPRIAA